MKPVWSIQTSFRHSWVNIKEIFLKKKREKTKWFHCNKKKMIKLNWLNEYMDTVILALFWISVGARSNIVFQAVFFFFSFVRWALELTTCQQVWYCVPNHTAKMREPNGCWKTSISKPIRPALARVNLLASFYVSDC